MKPNRYKINGSKNTLFLCMALMFCLKLEFVKAEINRTAGLILSIALEKKRPMKKRITPTKNRYFETSSLFIYEFCLMSILSFWYFKYTPNAEIKEMLNPSQPSKNPNFMI